MSNFFAPKKKCKDIKRVHKKFVYEDTKNILVNLGDLANTLKPLYKDQNLSKEDLVCNYCYKVLKKEEAAVKSRPDSSALEQEMDRAVDPPDDIDLEEEAGISTPEEPDASNTSSNPISSGEVYEPSQETVNNLNDTMLNLGLNISPLKHRKDVPAHYHETYADRKRRQTNDAFDSQIASKITKLYHPQKLDEVAENKDHIWLNIFKIAVDQCSNSAERIRLLTLLPQHLTKNDLAVYLPNVSSYAIAQARSLMSEGKIYVNAERDYSYKLLSSKVIEKVMEYYLDDDFNCTRQSPNTNDTMTISSNGEKGKVVKRFLTRHIQEIYKLFKKENPQLKISKSKFYKLRPKWVKLQPQQNACLCVYCENFYLMLKALATYLHLKDISNLEEKILASIVCSTENLVCVFKECEKCPSENTIDLKVINLTEDDNSEEITYSHWEKADLVQKTAIIQDFLITLRKVAIDILLHKKIKDIQRTAIKESKVLAKTSSSQLVLHVDFAENWSILLQNEVQSAYWSKKQISVFTAVCYYGKDENRSYAVVSDDTTHDSAHALMAMNAILKNLKEKCEKEFSEIVTVSDGAGSQFKNRYQFYEFRNAKEQRSWLFSATGHGKGACDGVGGLVKHYASDHNLRKDVVSFIRNAEDFANYVQNYTSAINILVLHQDELSEFRANKKAEWSAAKPVDNIQKIHYWKRMDNQKVYTARTAAHELMKVK